MPKQMTYASVAQGTKKKVTRRKKFLAEMEVVVPWLRLLALSDPMRRLAGLELGDDRIPDETTILNFRNLLERHTLTVAIFGEVNAYLAENGITLRFGTLVGATIIDAPSSTKNKAGKRDPDMSSTKKGTDWYFG